MKCSKTFLYFEYIVLIMVWSLKFERDIENWYDLCMSRRVLRYQRGNQNPYIEEGQTTIYKTYT